MEVPLKGGCALQLGPAARLALDLQGWQLLGRERHAHGGAAQRARQVLHEGAHGQAVVVLPQAEAAQVPRRVERRRRAADERVLRLHAAAACSPPVVVPMRARDM